MAKKRNCKNPKAEMTRRQSWAVFCMTGVDIRGEKWNREEVSTIISGLKSDGEVVTPEGTVLLTKQKIKAAGGNGNGKDPENRQVEENELPGEFLFAAELLLPAQQQPMGTRQNDSRADQRDNKGKVIKQPVHHFIRL